MGKYPVRPKTLLLKTVVALLLMATQAKVITKNVGVHEEVSTFTNTVITTKTASTTTKEDRIRT